MKWPKRAARTAKGKSTHVKARQGELPIKGAFSEQARGALRRLFAILKQVDGAVEIAVPS